MHLQCGSQEPSLYTWAVGDSRVSLTCVSRGSRVPTLSALGSGEGNKSDGRLRLLSRDRARGVCPRPPPPSPKPPPGLGTTRSPIFLPAPVSPCRQGAGATCPPQIQLRPSPGPGHLPPQQPLSFLSPALLCLAQRRCSVAGCCLLPLLPSPCSYLPYLPSPPWCSPSATYHSSGLCSHPSLPCCLL